MQQVRLDSKLEQNKTVMMRTLLLALVFVCKSLGTETNPDQVEETSHVPCHSTLHHQDFMFGVISEQGDLLTPRHGAMSAVRYRKGVYQINFDVSGVSWRDRDSPLVTLTVWNRHQYHRLTTTTMLQSEDELPHSVVLAESNKRFVRFTVLSTKQQPVNGAVNFLIIWP